MRVDELFGGAVNAGVDAGCVGCEASRTTCGALVSAMHCELVVAVGHPLFPRSRAASPFPCDGRNGTFVGHCTGECGFVAFVVRCSGLPEDIWFCGVEKGAVRRMW